MATDQIELLTREKNRDVVSHPRDVQCILESLPLRKQPAAKTSVQAKMVLDSVATEADELDIPGDGPSTQWLMAIFTGILYGISVVISIVLMCLIVASIIKLLAQPS